MTPNEFINLLYNISLIDDISTEDLKVIYDSLLVEHRVYTISEDELNEDDRDELYYQYGDDMMFMFLDKINHEGIDFKKFNEQAIKFMDFERMNPKFPALPDLGEVFQRFGDIFKPESISR